MYIKSPLSGAEFSNLYYFRIFPQLYSDKASKSDLGIGTEISDCNNPSRRIEELAKKSLNSPNSEGMTVAINGIILSANPTQSIWNGQMALTNGKFPSVFVRGSDGAGFSKWEALAKKSDLNSYAIKTFTVDVTQKTSAGQIEKYVVEKNISSETWFSSAKAIIPLFARKSGQSYICEIAVEYQSLRVQSDTSLQGVTAGILVVS